MNESRELWRPSAERAGRSQMAQFMRVVSERENVRFSSYQEFLSYSVKHANQFWQHLIDYFGVRCLGSLEPANLDLGFERYAWFPNLHLNFAENLLTKGNDEDDALLAVLEDGTETRTSYGQLRNQVAEFQKWLQDGFSEGDVLACYMPNVSETVVSMLACTGLGGVFTSSSSDFGVEGVIDRFSQSAPRVLVAAQGYCYGGKYFDCLDKIKAIVQAVPSIERVFIVASGHDEQHLEVCLSTLRSAQLWSMSASFEKPQQPSYVQRAFSDPLYIMYSSGTTGKPKCIVHSVGGTLLKHISELGPHCDLSKDKTIFFFTTCGWMMWNWLISALYFGSRVVLYDGSPSFPSLAAYLSLIDRCQINLFGTSPKFLRALENANSDLSSLHLDSLETILSTGSPLLPEQYDFVYNTIKTDVHLASISGGTDIMGCFFCGNPILPVYRGELQSAALGMDMACVDAERNQLIDQEGELVCKQSFPSRPIYFLDDEDNKKIRQAYFDEFPGWWHHGDFIKISAQGGAEFLGRSDSTLNPGGVRIGTSEIYRQTETLDYIEDSVCVGKQVDGDVDIYLFVKLVDQQILDDVKVDQIKAKIRANTTPRHVPKHVMQVGYIPYTRSGKKIEGVVSNILNGRPVTNVEAIVEPDSLVEYQKFCG